MANLIIALVLITVAVLAAELVRTTCRRLLTQTVSPRPRVAGAESAAAAPVAASVR